MRLRRWQLCLFFAPAALAVRPVVAQAITDVAPSARFPAAWYSPEHQVMSTMPPVTGAPYEARVVTSNQFSRVPVEKAPLQARDSAGRTRTESPMGPRTTQDGTQVEVHEVGVTDPVSQCSFQWEEPRWTSTPTATVQCQRHKAEYAGQAMRASSASMRTGEEHPSPDETDETEAIGERTFDGLRAVGLRRVRVIKNPDPKQSQTIESEVWTSPEMKEIVAIYVKGEGTSVELQKIKLGEPDPKMFYPPAGYKIEPLTYP